MSNAIAELDEVVDNTAPVEVVAETVVAETPAVKRGKGRPNVHPFAGRPYLLKDELARAMSDKESFVALMNETHSISAERAAELGDIAAPATELNFTIQGPIIQVIDQLHKLRGIYGDKAVVSISKDRLVPPTNKLYMQPITEVVEINGKKVTRRIYEEYCSSTIYGYVTVKI
jgi:hypothetical protein